MLADRAFDRTQRRRVGVGERALHGDLHHLGREAVGIDPGGLHHLREWIDVRSEFNLNGCHPLLCTRTGTRMTDAYIRRLMPRLGQKAGIAKRVHAHGLRHTHAAELRAEGIDIGIISKQLGHRSIATTARYLDHIAPYAVVEAIHRRVWS